jgi:tRNA 5-methylaminomethyl-2-thiouridine biosynthesis bifunctional protein
MSYQPLTAPHVGFDAEGHFRNYLYGDIYHSKAGALGQAEYVFIRGNGLPQRWRGRRSFTVCETGFGVGLNFLTLWNTWRVDSARAERLHMLSIEAHPFSREDLRQALQRVIPQAWQSLADQLVEQWPASIPGLHRLEFEGGAVTLTLAFGQAATVAPRLVASVDAYFFDGFSPKLNPEAWEPALLRQLSRLAAPDATFATWASNGGVRRALVAAGFTVSRHPGYAGKLHMSIGVRAPSQFPMTRAPKTPRKNAFRRDVWLQAREADRSGNGEVVVVGAGVAGAGIAQALALRGRSVTVIDPVGLGVGSTHAGHMAAALTPVIARDDNALARLSRAGSWRAQARWMALPEHAAPVRCGTLQVERDSGRMASLLETLQYLQLPKAWVRGVDSDEAAAIAGMPVARGGVFFGDGLLVQPAALIPALLRTPGIRVVT